MHLYQMCDSIVRNMNRLLVIVMALIASCVCTSDDHEDYSPAEETQHTYCKIATEELQATANATITRELRGVCTSKELRRTAAAIMRELHAMKDALILQATAVQMKSSILEHFDAQQNTRGEGLEPVVPTATVSGHVDAYYWTITDAPRYLTEGATVLSPDIVHKDITFRLRLSVANQWLHIRLVDASGIESEQFDYTVLLILTGKRDVRVDTGVPLRRLLRHARKSDVLFVKLLVY